jgi:hypothetical protein
MARKLKSKKVPCDCKSIVAGFHIRLRRVPQLQTASIGPLLAQKQKAGTARL